MCARTKVSAFLPCVRRDAKELARVVFLLLSCARMRVQHVVVFLHVRVVCVVACGVCQVSRCVVVRVGVRVFFAYSCAAAVMVLMSKNWPV